MYFERHEQNKVMVVLDSTRVEVGIIPVKSIGGRNSFQMRVEK
jgi:hypothetical protein